VIPKPVSHELLLLEVVVEGECHEGNAQGHELGDLAVARLGEHEVGRGEVLVKRLEVRVVADPALRPGSGQTMMKTASWWRPRSRSNTFSRCAVRVQRGSPPALKIEQ